MKSVLCCATSLPGSLRSSKIGHQTPEQPASLEIPHALLLVLSCLDETGLHH
jgi:hypothetical protein